MPPKSLIIGYGSIGTRHARVLEGLGAEVAIVSRRREGGGRRVFSSFGAAQADFAAEYVVIASETARHRASLAEIADSGFAGTVLVEKPLFDAPGPLPANRFRRAGIGYNLRFHPAVIAFRHATASRRVEMADFHVAQWLGDWRPGRDVATSYSASRALGGGALRDLSHELDLVLWLFGPWRRVAALGGRLGNVTLDADDGWGIVLACERCPVVTVHMNCLDRQARRTIGAQAEGESWHVDLIENTFDDTVGRRNFALGRDDTYATMHQALMDGNDMVCTLTEGMRVLELITAIETSAREGRFVEAGS